MNAAASPPTELGEVLLRFHQLNEAWWDDFTAAFMEYGPGAADETGLAGQWADMFRKVRKLKRAMWMGDPGYLKRESAQEILRDLISHAFLSLEMLERGMPGGRIMSDSETSQPTLFSIKTAHPEEELHGPRWSAGR